MRTLFVYLLAAALVVVALGVAFPDLWRSAAPAEAEERASRTPPVVVTAVERRSFADELTALGTVFANESVEITPTRSKHVAALHFEDGQQVEAGQLLVELESDEEKALLAEARAVLAERDASFARTKDLVERGISSESDLDAERAARLAAAARVTNLEATLDQLEIRAPFAGTVGLRRVSVGSLVQPQTLVTTLDDLAVVKVDFTIPETQVGQVQEGMSIRARADAWPGREFGGTIRAIDTRLDPRARSATVRAIVPNPDGLLRPGMLVKVRIDRGEAPVLQVPEEAIVQLGDEHFVFRVAGEDSIAERVPIRIGRRRVGAVEVAEGLAEGDRVVVQGVVRVQPGAPVAVVADRSAGT